MRASADVVHPARLLPARRSVFRPNLPRGQRISFEYGSPAHDNAVLHCGYAIMHARAIDIFVVGVGAVQGSAKTACVDPIPTYVSMRGSDPFLL